MMLTEWLAKLAAAKTLDTGVVARSAQNAANRATSLTGGRFQFVVTPASRGAKVIALPVGAAPRELAQRALARTMPQAAQEAAQQLAEDARSRLRP